MGGGAPRVGGGIDQNDDRLRRQVIERLTRALASLEASVDWNEANRVRIDLKRLLAHIGVDRGDDQAE